MTRVGPCLFTTILLVVFLVVSVSFTTVNFDNIPEQVRSPRTGYPVWHPSIKGYNQQLNDAWGLFVIIITFLGGYYIIKWTNDRNYTTIFILNDVRMASTEKFNYFLGTYSLFTSLAALALICFDVGKLWAATGILHNASEVVILMAMHQGGKIVSSNSVGWLAFYLVFAYSLTLFLDWPLDATWFKMQGLCADYALFIQFTRMYVTTRCHMRRDAIEGNPIINEEESTEEHHESRRLSHPQQTLLLFFAALSHIIGSVISILYVNQLTQSIFHLSYTITFSAITYFVYLDVNARSTSHRIIRLPETTRWKVFVVTLSSITLSLLTIRTVLITMSMSN